MLTDRGVTTETIRVMRDTCRPHPLSESNSTVGHLETGETVVDPRAASSRVSHSSLARVI
ncbi:hypothetical protein [Halostagnicola sp. A56]|uniref:hypothetical protein n=1 Tax=Halostagnicola sp. A56 TaxID=1495067 RepID=UPI0012E0EFAF|nr:hypothetical protein [Halostagnicola sp. A56]